MPVATDFVIAPAVEVGPMQNPNASMFFSAGFEPESSSSESSPLMVHKILQLSFRHPLPTSVPKKKHAESLAPYSHPRAMGLKSGPTPAALLGIQDPRPAKRAWAAHTHYGVWWWS